VPIFPNELQSQIESLLEPFVEQAATVRSIVAIDWPTSDHAVLLGASPDIDSDGLVRPIESEHPRFKNRRTVSFEELADWAAGSSSEAGEDLLLLPARLLSNSLRSSAEDFPFRAVVALFNAREFSVDGGWRLRRSLFDAGLICVGAAEMGAWKALCFLASGAVQAFDRLEIAPRGIVAMSVFTEGAGFANQLFRYAFLKLYALRHGLATALPEWEGTELFGLNDRSVEGLSLEQVTYAGFAENDRELWDQGDPRIDIDLAGYFQEIPSCWQPHRDLLRHLFELHPDDAQAIDAWRDEVTDGGRRPLVAIHVRRGDYRSIDPRDCPQFRPVPETWYVAWLRAVLPTLPDPVVFVSTDEPETVLPIFEEFAPVAGPYSSGVAPALPEHICDFEAMRRADFLAICNSSFSRMAAILASDAQQCFIPSFQTRRFDPYEPWIDPDFWKRFADTWDPERLRMFTPLHEAWAARMEAAVEQSPAIFFDVSDLVLDLLHHSTLSGIQRVQGEILRSLPASNCRNPIRFVVLNRAGGLFSVDEPALLNIIEDLCSNYAPRQEIESDLRALLDHAEPCTLDAGDVLLEVGAFWNIKGSGAMLQSMKGRGVIIGIFVHDVLPIAAPEYFEAASNALFTKSMIEALTFADFILTTSKFNKERLLEHVMDGLDEKPIRLMPLGHTLSRPAATAFGVSKAVSEIIRKEYAGRDYVLCVGTIEVRKNPTYLLNLWKMLVRSGRRRIPRLVFAGRQGWLVEDFMRQLKACNYLGGRIAVLHGVSDAELALLYENCLLTMFPSFVEGWGLPVGESLAHGKICISSSAGGISEVGGDLVDYIDPYNVREGLAALESYLDKPALRRARERDIAEHFKPRTWREVTDNFLETTLELAREAGPAQLESAILLPPDRFLPIGTNIPVALMEEAYGRLSAELSCVAGWGAPEAAGIRAAEPAAALRFRVKSVPGAKINLVLRLLSRGRDFRVTLRCGSGTPSEVLLTDGVERLAAITCTVEPGSLVNVQLFSLGAKLVGDAEDNAAWLLKGLLYFDPKGPAGKTPTGKALRGKAEFQPFPSADLRHTPKNETANEPAAGDRVLLGETDVDLLQPASSFQEFLKTPNCYWPSEISDRQELPLFADMEDQRQFVSGCGDISREPQLGNLIHRMRFARLSGPFISTTRFSEGAIFDRTGIWHAFGYLQSADAPHPPWIFQSEEGLAIAESMLAEAPFYEGSYLNFYNGNLHNYYHWLIEGLLFLDILTNALGVDSGLKIALPKSMDRHAVLDHRGSLAAVGLDHWETIEVDAPIIRVGEAFWVAEDFVQTIPATYVRDFQERIWRMYAAIRETRKRRLLVARKGPSRTICNLVQVEEVLARYGFETVYLEGMSMKDQILLFQGAEFVISPHGAGLANLVFCERGTKVIELMPLAQFRPFFWLISQKLGLEHAVQFCDSPVNGDFQSSIEVHTGKLATLMEKMTGARVGTTS